MKRFKFKLEVVLKERKRVEDLKQREWMMARRLLLAMNEDLTNMIERLEAAFGEATQLGAAGNIGMLHSIDGFIDGTKLRIEWKRQEIVRAEKLTEKKRVEYVKERQKREALEKLKERKYEEFKEELRKKELRELDELYVMSAGYKRRAAEEDEWEVTE